MKTRAALAAGLACVAAAASAQSPPSAFPRGDSDAARSGDGPRDRDSRRYDGAVVVAFDVQPDGSLTNQRELAELRGGRGGDGTAVDAEGRLYVSTGSSVDVFAPSGEFLGIIPAPRGLHGVAFGGEDKTTLFGIVFSGGLGDAEREKPGRRDPNDRAGLYWTCEVAACGDGSRRRAGGRRRRIRAATSGPNP